MSRRYSKSNLVNYCFGRLTKLLFSVCTYVYAGVSNKSIPKRLDKCTDTLSTLSDSEPKERHKASPKSHLRSQLLAELHTPLVERVQPPHEPLNRRAVLVDGQELPAREGVELGEEQRQRRPVPGEDLSFFAQQKQTKTGPGFTWLASGKEQRRRRRRAF